MVACIPFITWAHKYDHLLHREVSLRWHESVKNSFREKAIMQNTQTAIKNTLMSRTSDHKCLPYLANFPFAFPHFFPTFSQRPLTKAIKLQLAAPHNCRLFRTTLYLSLSTFSPTPDGVLSLPPPVLSPRWAQVLFAGKIFHCCKFINKHINLI